jgi:hypothetical protein
MNSVVVTGFGVMLGATPVASCSPMRRGLKGPKRPPWLSTGSGDIRAGSRHARVFSLTPVSG